jgi:hypothetical protein
MKLPSLASENSPQQTALKHPSFNHDLAICLCILRIVWGAFRTVLSVHQYAAIRIGRTPDAMGACPIFAWIRVGTATLINYPLGCVLASSLAYN